MAELVTVTETLRDAWQGLPRVVPTEAKLAFIRRLLDAGFPSLDIGSFVSPGRVPAMADTDRLLEALPAHAGTTLIALVANAKGLERLLARPGIDEALYPFSLSETFQQRNTNRTREQALTELTELTARCHGAGRRMYATVSMAFGNNEGDAFDTGELRAWLGRLSEAGVDRLGLADTTAQATPGVVGDVFTAATRDLPGPLPGVHLHATPATQADLVQAALDAGCRAFDAALGGLGGCQFARGAESNISTRMLANQLVERGFAVDLPVPLLDALDAEARRLAD